MSSKIKKSAKDSNNEHVQVFVRCRPMNRAENEQKCHSVVEVHGLKEISVQDRNSPKLSKAYSFDRVFGPLSDQTEVYRNVVEPHINDVLAGYNCTIFAYGQTGTGKTFTMEGDLTQEPSRLFEKDSEAGIIPRVMSALFDELRVLQVEFTIRISLLELYNEELYDLLSLDEVPPKLRLFDDSSKKGSVIVQGLQEVMVHTRAQVFDELRKGSAKRQIAATLMNANSSRSHTVFCVTVHTKENSVGGEELLKTGKLYLVDLAGSENIARSGSVDKRAREAGSINQSLLTLGRVITCLVEHQPHIPYRESKLTRILQDSLGGKTKTSIIATVSPGYNNFEETVSTLDYALRARHIANKPEVNQKVSKKAVLKEYMDVIESLRRKLDLNRKGSGVYVADGNYQQIKSELDSRNSTLSEKITQIKEVVGEMNKMEELFKNLSFTVEEKTQRLGRATESLNEVNLKVSVANDELAKTVTDYADVEELLKKVVEHEDELKSQAQSLLSVVDESHQDGTKIYNRLDVSNSVITRNKQVIQTFKDKYFKYLENVKNKGFEVSSNAQTLCMFNTELGKLSGSVETNAQKLKENFDSVCAEYINILERIAEVMEEVGSYTDVWRSNEIEVISKAVQERVNTLQLLETEIDQACSNYIEFFKTLQSQDEGAVERIKEMVSGINSKVDKSFLNATANLDTTIQDISSNQKYVENLVTDLISTEEEAIVIHQNCHKKISSAIEEVGVLVNNLDDIQAQCMPDVLKQFQIVEEKYSEAAEQSSVWMENIETKLTASADLIDQYAMEHSGCSSLVRNNVKDLVDNIIETRANAEDSIIQILTGVEELRRGENELLRKIKNSTDVSATILESTLLLNQDKVLQSQNELKEYTVNSSNRFVNEIDVVHQSLLAASEKQQGVLESCSEHIRNNNVEVQAGLQCMESLVNDLVHSEFSHDKPTGLTPARKTYSIISKLATLPSPVKRKVKNRVQNAIARLKKVSQKPRKPLSAVNGSVDTDDEFMASDSEVTCKRNARDPKLLPRATSLTDLSADGVFSRPLVPIGKRIVRKARR